MIIVSQDKCTILNFNNIQNIRIETYGTHVKSKKIYKIFAGNFEGYAIELGTYDMEERAKEVLKDIICSFKFDRCEAVGRENVIYEMPKM